MTTKNLIRCMTKVSNYYKIPNLSETYLIRKKECHFNHPTPDFTNLQSEFQVFNECRLGLNMVIHKTIIHKYLINYF